MPGTWVTTMEKEGKKRGKASKEMVIRVSVAGGCQGERGCA